MMDVPIPLNEVQDPAEKNQPGIGAGRDPERTPMLWNDSELAGFTVGKPWLRVGAHYAGRDVASQERAAYSMLKLYRRLISLRANHPVLVNGSLNRIAAEGNLLQYERGSEAARYLILLNLGLTPVQTLTEPGRVLLSTDVAQDGREVNGLVELGDAQACIVELD